MTNELYFFHTYTYPIQIYSPSDSIESSEEKFMSSVICLITFFLFQYISIPLETFAYSSFQFLKNKIN